ncbi:MAG: HEAT repeat domain-containing protein [Pirellulales bacterium]
MLIENLFSLRPPRPLRFIFFCLMAIGAPAWAADEMPDELVQLVVDLLADKDKDIRALGFEQVRTGAKGQAATKLFAAQLAKLPADAQAGLISALADRGDAAARPAVLEALATSRDEAVRVAAIGALGPLGEAADVPRLAAILGSGPPSEKQTARASLVRLAGDSAAKEIVSEMKKAAPPLRVALIEVLTARRALTAVPELCQAALDEEKSVRTAAMAALGQLAGPEHLAAMVQGVLRASKGAEREAAEKAVALVCSRIADPAKRADPLLAAINPVQTHASRAAMLPTLGRVGGPKALDVIEAAIADPALHDVGIRALCNWPDASTADRLIELARTDEHAEHRDMARAALIRIAPLPDNRSDADRLALVKKVMGMCASDAERNLVLKRAHAVRTVDTLRFLQPYVDQPQYAQQACESVVELAHHRVLRDANKAEFHALLDKVIETSKDATVIERANRYQKGQTWARPANPQRS